MCVCVCCMYNLRSSRGRKFQVDVEGIEVMKYDSVVLWRTFKVVLIVVKKSFV